MLLKDDLILNNNDKIAEILNTYFYSYSYWSEYSSIPEVLMKLKNVKITLV